MRLRFVNWIVCSSASVLTHLPRRCMNVRHLEIAPWATLSTKPSVCSLGFAPTVHMAMPFRTTPRVASNRTTPGLWLTGNLRTPCGLQHNGSQPVHVGCRHNGRSQIPHGSGLYGKQGSGSHTHGFRLARYVTRAMHLAHFLLQESNAYPVLQDRSLHQTVPYACFAHQGGKVQKESRVSRAKSAMSRAPTRRTVKRVPLDVLAQMERLVSIAPQEQSLSGRLGPALACSARLEK